jgi:hypothetical protein
MRNGSLHATLRAFAEDAASQLSFDISHGAEVPFELVEERSARRPTLYCYRPLTDAFIADRFGVLTALDTYAPARQALDRLEGLDAYLERRGATGPPGALGEAALRALLGAVFEETSSFELDGGRFARAYEQLEEAVYEGRTLSTAVASLRGLELESDEIALGDGLALARGEVLEGAPAEAVWGLERERGRPATLIVLRLEEEHGGIAAAPVRFRRLLSALRLFERGAFALSPVAWVRADGGSWRLAPLPGVGGGGQLGDTILLPASQEDELRAFANLVARRTPEDGELAWALRRFEQALERELALDALTDHLLALRAMLEPEGPASGRLAQRLAAICALGPDRPGLAERVARAVALERAAISGLAGFEDAALPAIVDELATHGRALLRDVLCGHLSPDLVGVADGLLEETLPVPA